MDPQEFLLKAQVNHAKSKTRRKRGDSGIFFMKERNLYVGQLSFIDPESGKRVRPKVYGRTEKEARAKKKALERQLEDGGNLSRDQQRTVASWMNHYYENYRKNSNLAIKTIESEEMWIRVHIIPGLGNKKLSRLTADIIQSFYTQRLERPEKDGGPLASQSIRHIHGVLKRGLRKAMELKLISSNPTDNVELPKVDELPLRALEREEAFKVLEVAAARKFRYLTAIALAIKTGLRRSEIFGLRWKDIDMERGLIRVRQTSLTTRKGVVIVARTKTKSSQDAVGVPSAMLQQLRLHKESLESDKAKAMKKAEEDRAKYGEAVNDADYWEENDLVFKQENGQRVDPRSISHSFKQILIDAGFPKTRLHDLRHTFIALLIEQGVHGKKVQLAARHSSYDQTMNRYGHLFSPMADGAVDVLDERPQKKMEEQTQETFAQVEKTDE